MTASSSKVWPNGVSVPLTTPFKADESIDDAALAAQVVRLAQAGVNIVLLGTNGEASHLSAAERRFVVETGRKALDQNGFESTPLLVGTGGGSASTTIELCKDAADAGATHAIVICPGYFSFAMGRDRQAILDFFTKVMDNSPIPVMIYNFPGAAAGIDLNSDELCTLAEHPNCFGAKLTCAMIGKGQRLAAYTQTPEFLSKRGPQLASVTETGAFQVLPGFSESLLPALLAKHHGCITGTGNVFPKTISRLYTQALKGLKGDAKALEEAVKLQDRVARSDFIIVKAGIQGTKHALDHFVQPGLGGTSRLPLGKLTPEVRAMVETELKEDWEFECSL